MAQLHFATKHKKKLLDIKEVEPYNDKDKPVFDEIIEVLKKHNALDRFGLTLLHQHFDVPDDEVLIETTDVETRVQTIQPMKIKDVDASVTIETAWRLDSGQPVMGCLCIKMGDHMHLPRPSDSKLKAEIEDINYGVNEIMQLRPVSYYYTQENNLKLSNDKQLGLIAQEVEGLIPEIVKQNDNFKSVDYIGLIPVFIKTLQEQQNAIENLKEQLEELKAVSI